MVGVGFIFVLVRLSILPDGYSLFNSSSTNNMKTTSQPQSDHFAFVSTVFFSYCRTLDFKDIGLVLYITKAFTQGSPPTHIPHKSLEI